MYRDTIKQGADYDLTVFDREDDRTTPIDLTGCTAVVQARRHPGDADISWELDSADEDGNLTVTAEAGRIDIHVPASITETLSGTYRMQLEITWPSGRVDRLLDAVLTVSPEVVR